MLFFVCLDFFNPKTNCSLLALFYQFHRDLSCANFILSEYRVCSISSIFFIESFLCGITLFFHQDYYHDFIQKFYFLFEFSTSSLLCKAFNLQFSKDFSLTSILSRCHAIAKVFFLILNLSYLSINNFWYVSSFRILLLNLKYLFPLFP